MHFIGSDIYGKMLEGLLIRHLGSSSVPRFDATMC